MCVVSAARDVEDGVAVGGVFLDGEVAFNHAAGVIECDLCDLVCLGATGLGDNRPAEMDLAVGGAAEEVCTALCGKGESVDGGGAMRCEDVEGFGREGWR